MMSESPKVSVLIPIYNVEQLLPRCLDSVLAQTMTDFEVVCVNDASPDGSAAILDRYAKADNRVRIITKAANEGLMMARRTGYIHARGEYFFFLDSDDYIPADALKKLLDKVSETNADIVVGEMRLFDNHGHSSPKPRTGIECADGQAYLAKILSGTICSLCGSLFRRSLFDGHTYESFMHQSFSEDRLLITQLLIATRPSVATIPDLTYCYWVNTDSITRKPLTLDAVREQLTALFRTHAMVVKGAPELVRRANAFIIRYISYYMEQVPWRREIRDFNDVSRRLLTASELRRNCSALLRLHTLALLHVPGYRHLAWTGRKLIRRLQGKL